MSSLQFAFVLIAAGVAFFAWGILEWRSGRARIHWPGAVYSETDDRFLYLVAMMPKFFVLPIAAIILATVLWQ